MAYSPFDVVIVLGISEKYINIIREDYVVRGGELPDAISRMNKSS